MKAENKFLEMQIPFGNHHFQSPLLNLWESFRNNQQTPNFLFVSAPKNSWFLVVFDRVDPNKHPLNSKFYGWDERYIYLHLAYKLMPNVGKYTIMVYTYLHLVDFYAKL